MDEVHELRQRVELLEAQLRAVLATLDEPRRAPATDTVVEAVEAVQAPARAFGRRRLLGTAAGAAAGVAAAGVTAVAGPALPAAAVNGNLVLGSANNTSSGSTGVAADATGYGLGCTDRGLLELPLDISGTVFGHTKGRYLAGVTGYAEGGDAGVLGVSASGVGVVARSTSDTALVAATAAGMGAALQVEHRVEEDFALAGTGVESLARLAVSGFSGAEGTGVLAVTGSASFPATPHPRTAVDAQGLGALSIGVRTVGGRAPLLLEPNGGAPIGRVDAHAVGELVEDANGALWLCVAAGSPGTWRELAGPSTAGAFHLLPAPVRCYDSRDGLPPLGGVKGPLLSGQTRDIDLSVGGGVPAGAIGALLNITVTQTSTSGFLRAYKKGVAQPLSSALNWDHAGTNLANNATVACDSARRITIACFGAGASTHLVVGVTGYYR